MNTELNLGEVLAHQVVDTLSSQSTAKQLKKMEYAKTQNF
jgi:hypothetical protein